MNWLIFAFLAVLCGSIREIIQKKALKNEHTLEFLVIRGFFIIIISLLFIPIVNFNISWQGYAWVFAVAVLASIAILNRNRALKHIEVSHLEPLMNVQPLFVLLIAFIFLGERVSYIQLTGILLLVLGTYVLELDHHHKGIWGPFKHLAKSKYSLMVLLATFIYGITNTMDRYILTSYFDAMSYFFILWIMINVIFFIYYFCMYKPKELISVFRNQGKKIFFPALLSVLLVVFFYKAIELAYVSLVVAVFRLESLVVTITGGRFFQESYLKQKTLACCIMVIGAICVIV